MNNHKKFRWVTLLSMPALALTVHGVAQAYTLEVGETTANIYG